VRFDRREPAYPRPARHALNIRPDGSAVCVCGWLAGHPAGRALVIEWRRHRALAEAAELLELEERLRRLTTTTTRPGRWARRKGATVSDTERREPEPAEEPAEEPSHEGPFGPAPSDPAPEPEAERVE
jgi:hypothetical protein